MDCIESDCYILHTSLLEITLLSFNKNFKLNVIKDSDVQDTEEDVLLGECGDISIAQDGEYVPR